jgi:energy-coupling factor transporter ATP-binding protein EcfA2
VSSPLRHVAFVLLLGLLSLHSSAGLADPGPLDGGKDEAGADAAADASVPEDVTRIRETSNNVRALLAGTLDVAVSPQSLFDPPLGDERRLSLEAQRLTMLQKATAAPTGKRSKPLVAIAGGDAGSDGGREVDATLWAAQLDLDRARLEFYLLPPDKREALLKVHTDRQVAAAPPPTPEELRAREAEAERQRAQTAALAARSEAERAASMEYARLLEVEKSQVEFAKTMATERETLAARQEAALGWQRRAKEVRQKNGADSEKVDAVYDDLRKALRAARDDLDRALDAVAAATGAPSPGPDALGNLPASLDLAAVRSARERTVFEHAKLDAEARGFRQERAAALLAETTMLNGERLALLPFLSASKRDASVGFGEAGVDQAAAEVRQLSLVLRYHRHATSVWFTSFRKPGQSLTQSVWRNLLVVFEWVGAAALFVWIRRRIPLLLKRGRERALESDREERLASPSIGARAFAFAQDVHRPVEWLLFAMALSALLPAASQNLLEVQLVSIVVQWVLGGALTVDVVNSLAGQSSGSREEADSSRALRLRSLRLVGRVVVAVGLVLVLSSRLVGKGTIYQWVISSCWLASIPVVAILVRWWRKTVFRRAERARKKSQFERWVLANQTGWKSFFAASAGGAYLFGRGVFRAAYGWVGRFGATRSVLAYLFRRQLDKLSAERAELPTGPLPGPTFDALGPDVATAKRIVVESCTERIEALVTRIRDRKGGVVAVVGARGMGKSTLIDHLRRQFPDTILTGASAKPELDMRTEMAVALAVTAGTLEGVCKALPEAASRRAVLIDDAQRLIQPVMGGLAGFDELLSVASRHSKETTWVLAIDEVVWLFLQRARGARPLFDEVIRLAPWREEEIIDLLRQRTEHVGVEPTFERLLEKLPPQADEIDRQEALEQRAGSYYRLLWDYAAGNPGVALHMWRRSLGVDEDGIVYVRFFQAPDTGDLERLPDAAVFVLRAVMQLAPTTADEIVRATMLSAADVEDALRYAIARGYLAAEGGRYSTTWAWFRPIVTHLQRRHLLVAP